jgi:hypothetical protein
LKNERVLNAAFERFLNEITTVRKNIEEESEFSRGYLQCISDIVGELSNDSNDENLDNGIKSNYLINIIKRRIDMKSRAELLDELIPGLNSLLAAYKDGSQGGE